VALDALLEACEGADLTVTAVECELKLLKAYQAVLANHVMQPNLTTTITTIIQTVRDIVQNRLTAALRLSSPARNLFYLLSEGEALGCYEAKNGILELVDIPFSGLVEEKGVRLDVLGRPASEPLNLPRPTRKPVTLEDIFNAANETVVEPAAPAQHPTPVSKNLQIDWITILELGRRPYSNLSATTQNFNGLRRAFEKNDYNGLIELKSSENQLHYLIEKGVPVRECVLDPLTGSTAPNTFSVFEALDRPGYIINVYLEQKKASPDQFSADYLQTLVDGSFSRAVKVVQEALRAGLTPEVIYDAIFATSMRQIGVLWQTGQISIAQEHLATGMTEYCRNMVMSSKGGIPSKRIGRVLLTSVSGNNHTLGLNLLGDVFRWQGWEVFPLFSEMPENEITEAVYRHQIDLICLSVSLPGQTIRAIKTVKTLRQSGWKGFIEVGGAAFINNPEAFKQTGADFLGGDAQATVEYATRLILERDKALNPN
jgi:methanogenic corrinoid protein MtbC1